MTPGRLSARALLLVALLALASRALFELQVRAEGASTAALARHLIGDERAYDALARRFAAGTLQRERSFYQEPLYAFVLGLAFRAAPPPAVPDDATDVRTAPVHVGAIVLQHALGLLTCVLVATLGARVLSPRAGLVAGLLAALSGPLVFAESQILKEGPALLLWMGSLHLWLDVLEDRGRRRAAGLGLLLGLGALLRGNTWILLALVLATLLARVGGRRRPIEAALVLAGALLAVCPATFHNLRRGELVLTTYQSGSNAAIGMPDSDDPRGGLVYVPLRAGRGDALFEEGDAVAVAEQAEGRRLSGPEVSSFWWRHVADVVARRPGVAAQRVLIKLAAVFHPDEIPDVKDWRFFRREVPALASWLSDLTLVGPLALLGLFLLPWRGRPGLLVVSLSLLAVALTLMIFYVFGRYRLAAAPALWILAAGAVDEGLRRVRAASGARRAATAGVLLAAGAGLFAVGRVPLRLDADSLGTGWVNASMVEYVEAAEATDPAVAAARREASLAAARRALEAAPGHHEARTRVILALDLATPVLPARRAEADAEALRLLVALHCDRTLCGDGVRLLALPRGPLLDALADLRRRPSAPGRDEFLSSLLAQASRRAAQALRDDPPHMELALELLDEALRREPQRADALTQKGLILKRLGRLPEAEAVYRAALATGEATAEVANNLGNVLISLSRPGEAVPFFERALALEPGNAVIQANLARARAAASR